MCISESYLSWMKITNRGGERINSEQIGGMDGISAGNFWDSCR